MQSSNAAKKRQEEKNAKAIRELAALPANRHCFECGQRGPTYVNITEGSFCCTSCSGMLRGLNPPHRVKSISMASFSNDDIDKIRSLGNAENAKIWLGLFNGTPPNMTNREDIQTFIIKKYEKKTWYVSPAEMAEQERLMSKVREITHKTEGSEKVAVPKAPELDFFASDPFAEFNSTNSASIGLDSVYPTTQAFPVQNNHSPQLISPPAFMAPPPPFPTTQNSLLGPPAHSLPARPAQNSHGDNLFADFDSKFNEMSIRGSNTMDTFGSPFQQNAMPKSATVNSSFPTNKAFPMTSQNNSFFPSSIPKDPVPMPTVPVSSNPFQTLPPPVPASNPSAQSFVAPQKEMVSAGDKYSALAELDELFHSHPTNNSPASGSQSEHKPSWMPSGFSTGLPPSQTSAFPNAKPIPTLNGGVPKSNTLGSISDLGVNNPFCAEVPPQHVPESNPFASSASSFNVQQAAAPTGWPNPFATAPETNNGPMNPKWNPFL